jgi:hypothetical protein
MVVFQNALYVLDQIGFTDIFLPFILIFTILFAILQKIHVFGEDDRKFNGIIALALAIGAIIPHSLGRYPPGTDIVQILNTALPNISLLVIAVIFFLVLLGIFGGGPAWGSQFIGGIVTIAAIAAITIIFGSAAGWWQTSGILTALSDPDIQATIIIIAVFWIIMTIITQEEGTPGFAEETGSFFDVAKAAALMKADREAREKARKGGG